MRFSRLRRFVQAAIRDACRVRAFRPPKGESAMNARRSCATRLLRLLLLLFIVVLLNPPLAEGATIYVKADAAGGNDGISWATAYTDLQQALTAATVSDDIGVSAGTYTPVTPVSADAVTEDERKKSFNLRSGVALYGGFAGTEEKLEDRNIAAKKTILSGNIGNPDTDDDNSYNVVTATDVDHSAVLDGFTITGGNANKIDNPWGSGGGMYISQIMGPKVTNCTFSGNSAINGGGMFNANSSSEITNCTFSGNSADKRGGGMMVRADKAPTKMTVTNCTFFGNSSPSGGGMNVDVLQLRSEERRVGKECM